VTDLSFIIAVGEMLCQSNTLAGTHSLIYFPQGFLPVIFAWLRKQGGSVQLEAEPSNKLELTARPLSGWKVLLLWIPAACDLTGTTVRRDHILQ